MGPQTVSVTDGAQGAYALDTSGEILHLNPLSDESVLEKTGAGDAYAAGFLAGLLQNYSLVDCMRQGSLSSHSVMKEVGATEGLLKKDAMQSLLEQHKDYQPVRL